MRNDLWCRYDMLLSFGTIPVLLKMNHITHVNIEILSMPSTSI